MFCPCLLGDLIPIELYQSVEESFQEETRSKQSIRCQTAWPVACVEQGPKVRAQFWYVTQTLRDLVKTACWWNTSWKLPNKQFYNNVDTMLENVALAAWISLLCPKGRGLLLFLLILVLRLLLLLCLLLCLLLQFLLDHVCINFHLNFRLANSSPSSLPTSQLSVHRWTSTWDQTSSVCTAGPQPGTFPAQCAPLDCWTSTWELPSSVLGM